MHPIASPVDAEAAAQKLPSFGVGIGFQANQATPQAELDQDAIDTLVTLGVTRYRLNARWAAMTDTGAGAVDQQLLDELATNVERLLEAGIEPLIAFDNVALPERLKADGGWRNVETIDAYIDFVGAVGARVGHLVDQWLTATNPIVDQDLSAVEHLVLAHRQATVVLRAHCPTAQIGTSIGACQFGANAAESIHLLSDTWLAALAEQELAIDFAALNVDCETEQAVATIADAVRLLAQRTTAQSFILVETIAGSSSRAVDHTESIRRFESGQRAGLVERVREQILELRNEHLAVTGTFSWPFAHPAEAGPIRMGAYHATLVHNDDDDCMN